MRGSDAGAFCWILVTANNAYVVTQNIEGPRLSEEVGLSELGFEVLQHPWYAPELWSETVARVAGPNLGVDAGPLGRDVSANLIRLRLPLLVLSATVFVGWVWTAYLRSRRRWQCSAPGNRSATLRLGWRRDASAGASFRLSCWLARMSECGTVPPLPAERRAVHGEAMVVIVGVRSGSECRLHSHGLSGAG